MLPRWVRAVHIHSGLGTLAKPLLGWALWMSIVEFVTCPRQSPFFVFGILCANVIPIFLKSDPQPC